MSTDPVCVGESVCPLLPSKVVGGFRDIDGERYALIENVDRLPPFLMSVVSHGDFWLFVGSNGAFTAGRVDPNGAAFPYQTADKILRRPDASGAITSFLVHRNGRRYLWEPWQESGRVYPVRRNLHKHEHCGSVIFEEENPALGLAFRWSLGACEPYGLVRDCSLVNTGDGSVEVDYIDGWHQIVPPGVSHDTFNRLSYLAAGYMRHERVAGLPLGIFTYNAGITDSSSPCESLRAAAGWTLGHPNPTILLSDSGLDAFRRGEQLEPDLEVRGELGALLVADTVRIEPGDAHEWLHVLDTMLDHRALVRLSDELKGPACLSANVREAVKADCAGLRRLIAAADGLQQTADDAAGLHHFANVLNNCFRGGTLENEYSASRDDIAAFLLCRNKALAESSAGWLSALPDSLTLDELRTAASSTGDAQLTRLAREYLPLTFSRRHGDPSRPWNFFGIHVKDAAGLPVYGYQGNWRDIFQNWEALAQSYPGVLPSMIAVFLNASTADGYNPYRITREGIDWEVHSPSDPWSNLGYWGDHQIVYLLRLLESSERFRPGALAAGLAEAVYSYANVPYEIAGFDAILGDPRHTIAFNHPLHEELLEKTEREGSDAKLLAGANGQVLLVTLAEKLLTPLLAKLTNLVPEGGIWMNTQRPEWNDANNALAGWGLSVVTTQYLRRYLVLLDGIFGAAPDGAIPMSAPVARLLERVAGILKGFAPNLEAGFDDAARFDAVDALGRAGEAYRTVLYRKGICESVEVPVCAVQALLTAARKTVEQTIRANRQHAGMYHSYNVLHVTPGRAEIRRLVPMLEGQVAALSSGMLSPDEAIRLLKALRASDLYRADQRSYMLYPDREIKPFLERNTLPEKAVERAPSLRTLIDSGEKSLVSEDQHGRLHFNADLRNSDELAARIDALASDPRWSAPLKRDRQALLGLWETVFRHSAFTGRSGTFFMFEGLGSIYWHMVAKLLVAVQETWRRARADGADCASVRALADSYHDIRNGLGFRKTPSEYGAFPTDPYSHTPRHKGAQQPGMTGQVKEEILTRWGELGVDVEGGCLRFDPRLLQRSEFREEPFTFSWVDVSGADRTWDLPSGSLAFTYCQVAVCYRLSETAGLTLWSGDSPPVTLEDAVLSGDQTGSVMARRGEIDRVLISVREKELHPGS